MYNPARDTGNIGIKTQNEDKQKKKKNTTQKTSYVFFFGHWESIVDIYSRLNVALNDNKVITIYTRIPTNCL